MALPDLDLCTEDTCGYAQVKERSSERNALELSACTESTIQCAEHRHEADWTDCSLRVRGLHFLLAALGAAVSEATHTNSPACPTAQFSMVGCETAPGRVRRSDSDDLGQTLGNGTTKSEKF